jgi:O-antigen/teichoic acid export membrane protein
MIKKNIIASYIGNGYTVLIGVIMLPVYLTYMGKEAYGLVGFYVLLLSMLRMFDMGLSPSIGRATARYNGDKKNPARLVKFLHLSVRVFVFIAIIFTLVMFSFSYEIATKWLTIEELNYIEVSESVKLMAVIVALRWISGLYRGVITGYERFVWLNSCQVIIATLRFIFVIPVLIYLYQTPVDFFLYQMVVGIIEAIVLIYFAYYLLPKVEKLEVKKIKLSDLSGELKFSGVLVFTGIVSILITQADKLIMSGILTLSNYAIFNVAVLAASGVLLIGRPFINVLRATITRLYAEGKREAAFKLYKSSTQLVAIGGTVVSVFFWYSGGEFLLLWTGDHEVVEKATTILWMYSLGNAVMLVAGMQILLQYAEGILRYHFFGNIVFALIILPAVYFLANKYGAIGAGIAWLSSASLIFFIWIPIVHRRFFPSLHLKWLVNDVLLIFISGFVSGGLIDWLVKSNIIDFENDILFLFFQISMISLGSAFASSYVRTKLLSEFFKLSKNK